jgi:hypothetical protein
MRDETRSLDVLAEGYDAAHRRLEIVGISLFFACELLILRNLAIAWDGLCWPIAAAGGLGVIAADFISGFVHWAGDTWGAPDFPVLGRNFIRPFRHHHVDPKAITHHDFIATNGNNCMTTLIGVVPCVFIDVAPHTRLMAFFLWFVVALAAAVFATNQFHKWAHLEDPGPTIRWLQRKRLILSPEHHSVHHERPYDRHYCITTGWLNPVLVRVGFFPRLERLITRVTGALPRRDDIGEVAARALAAAKGVVDGDQPEHAGQS